MLCTSSPSAGGYLPSDLVRIGAASGEVQEDLCLLVGTAAQRRRMPGVSWSVCSAGLPAGSILEVEPGVYSLSPEALCVAVAREVGCIQAFAPAQELCSKISLSDRGKFLPPYSSPVMNKLAKDKDQPPDVGYFEVEPVLTPDRLADYLAVCKGPRPNNCSVCVPYLRKTCAHPWSASCSLCFRFRFPMAGLPAVLLRPTTRSSSMTVRRQSRGCRMQFAMRIRKQPGLTWNTTVSWAIPLGGDVSMMKSATRA